jgi:tetratricopeptide (TPR) repeat protein
MKQVVCLLLILYPALNLRAQEARIYETEITMNTYPFSDPDPVISPDRIYPYFRFDGYTREGKPQAWKMVVLENDYIKVFVCPDVGGKIWGAIEKSSGKEFLYFNHSAKFRDVAMRGAWSSGGLEYNFGDIGHIPTCATPVDYVIKEYPDNSVSCVVGAIDLPSGTKWNVEIKLEANKAYFETIASWHNTSELPVTYYHWMNAAAKADGNLEFIYPGTKHIGHGGEVGDWPLDNGRNVAMYENNNFGIYKSYHVINAYSNFFGGYWQDDDFGFGHYSTYDDKPGKKLWIWGLSDQGMIWEDLLTDSDGQYIEYQAGKLFNQAAHSSSFTPFKHREFVPYDSDRMRELWFPLCKTGGMVAASEYGVLNVERKNGKILIKLSPLQSIESTIKVTENGNEVFLEPLVLSPLQLYTKELQLDGGSAFTVEIGNKHLVYTSDEHESILNRPVEPLMEFDWHSAHGLYTQGLELEKQRRYPEALEAYESAYQKEPSFLPVIGRLAMAHYRKMAYQKSLDYCLKGLAIDTYDPLSNYVYSLVNTELQKPADAKSGFSIAAQSVGYRSAAYTKLAETYMREKNLNQAEHYAQKALHFNASNIQALEILSICCRKMNKKSEALLYVNQLEALDACNAFVACEHHLWENNRESNWDLAITNELPHETYLDLAIRYYQFGCTKEAINVLKVAPVTPIVAIWLAYLDNENSLDHLQGALELSAEMVFPHRNLTLQVIDHFLQKHDHWKLNYYAGVISWRLNNLEKAKACFSACADQPDFVAFYLSKISLFEGDTVIEQEALQRAHAINPDDWRLNLAYIEWYMKMNDPVSASRLAHKFYQRYPEKSVFGMKYALALMAQQKYKTCLAFLDEFDVLPYEGATEGRAIYHETCLRLAFDALGKGGFSKAIGYAEKAKRWPANLGVGKHYDVDERLDNFVIALAYDGLKKTNMARECYERVANHHTPDYLSEGSKLYLQAVALNKLNRKADAQERIDVAQKKDQDNRYLKWVDAAFNHQNGSALAEEILGTKVEIQVYDTQYVDSEFELLIDFLNLLRSLN